MEWNQWCRLCGKEDGSRINIFIKNESLFNIEDAIHRFFSIEIMSTEENSKTICVLCNDYLLSLNNYADKVYNVQQLFLEIESNLKIGNQIDTNELRLKYNLQLPTANTEVNYFVKLHNLEKENSQESDIKSLLLGHNIKNRESHHINIPEHIPLKRKKNIEKTDCQTLSQTIPDSLYEIGDENSKTINLHKRLKSNETALISNSENENSNSFDNEFHDSSSIKSWVSEYQVGNSQFKDGKERPIENKKRIYKTGEKHFQCEECQQKFTRESNYLYHIKKSHKGLPPCEFCGKVCKTKQKLRLHLELHLPPEEREKLLYKCPHCTKKFTQSAKVKEHVRAIHLQEKPFVCEQCGKNFASQSNLCSHKRTHDNKSRLNCSLCTKIFNNPHKLRFHIKNTHNSTGHPCSVCGQVLKTRKTLRNHMLIHSDAKPFKCNYCGKDFKRDKNLQIHMITHSGLKPFACRFCSQSYANRSNCKKHEKHSHSTEYEAAAAIINNEPQKLIQKKLPNIAQLEAMLEQLKAERELATVKSTF